MPDPETPASEEPVDYTISIGAHRFDPVVDPVRARRRTRRAAASADSDAVAGDEPVPDPADTRIVQVVHPLTAQDMARLRDTYGLALTAYVPNLAYVERVPPAVLRRLRRDPLVRAVVPYLPEFKISPSIFDPGRERPEDTVDGEHHLDASLFDRGSIDRVLATLESAGAHDIAALDDRPIGGFARVRFRMPDERSLDPIAELDDVRWIEPIHRMKADNVAAASVIQSGDASNASIWGKGLHGEGQVIGMMDDGPLDINHCFFDDVAPNTPGPTHRKVLALRNATGTAAGGHATFTSGCAAGDERSNSGGNVLRGGAWAAKLVSGNFHDVPASNTLLAELTAAMGSGAFVHSNSWHDVTAAAGAPALYNQNASDVDTFTWTNENHIVLGSSGNNTPAPQEQGPPGTAKNVVCVSAAQAGTSAMNLGSGNPGPTADGRQKPDLVAVGCGIQSAMVGTACGTGSRSACATSYSTPHAAAAAVLVRQYLTEGWYPSGAKVAANAMVPTGALLKAILANATVDMTGVAGYPNMIEGWGLIRLDRTLFFSGSRRKLSLWDVRHATGPTNRETRTHTIQVDDSTEQLKITLAFSDPAPAIGSFASPTVNDLDLKVTAPDGTFYVGNDFTNGVSTPNSPHLVGDSLNTIETVMVDNPVKGRWTIDVLAFRVAVGNPGQGYGLVATATTKSRCFVAGTVYGDPDHPDVEALRAWRDRRLRPDAPGHLVMAGFSRADGHLGPVAARAVDRLPAVRAVLRQRVLPLMASAVSPRPAAGAG